MGRGEIFTLICVVVAIVHSVGCWRLQVKPPQHASKMQLHSQLANGEVIDDVLTAWKRGFVNCKEEICTKLEGDLPVDLVGTLYRNGYGKFTVGKETVVHPFDSDGMITAISFREGQALFRNRIVRTTGFMRERRARRILYRGVFGTSKQGFLSNFLDLKLKNTANTHVAYWGEKLLALWEGGLPYRLEADSLRTLGEYRMKGLLKPNQALAAHYKVDPDKNTLVSFSAKQTPPSGIEMTVLEFNPDYNVNISRTFSIKGFGLFHDFAITKNYYIFTRCPLKLDPLPYVLGKKVLRLIWTVNAFRLFVSLDTLWICIFVFFRYLHRIHRAL